MARILIRHPDLPTCLQTWMLLDDAGVPRYWPLVWQVLHGATLEPSTLGQHLSGIDQLYRVVAEQAGDDCLDRLLTQKDVDRITVALEACFSYLKNDAARRNVDNGKQWYAAVSFVRQILNGLIGSAQLGAIDVLYASLRPAAQKQGRKRVRALPALVVEELYIIADPFSSQNPFRFEKERWTFYVLLLLLLQQGLRRGEAGLLTPGSIHDGLDLETGESCFWMNVTTLDGEEDPRYERPSIKTAQSHRQIPLTSEIATAIDHYVCNCRGTQDHPFLLSSSWGKPLSLRSMNYALEVITRALSPTAREQLKARNEIEVISPHDLRHTCAVARLSEFVSSGLEMKLALQCLRSFFGWSERSKMPSYYARAFFEDRLRTIWRGKQDDRAAVLREIRRIEMNSGVLTSDAPKGEVLV